MQFDQIIIFTDGACSGNPGKGGWGAVVVTPDGHVKELGDFSQATTNNRMELTGTIHALVAVSERQEEVALYTDSTYVIRGITQWIHGWRKRGWKNGEGGDVANRDLWEKLAIEIRRRTGKGKVHWHYVRGHSGVPGNERVDEIAVNFTKGARPALYDGPLTAYAVPILDLPEDTSLPEMKPKNAAPKKAYSYLSLVDGQLRRHESWSECEAQVKGRSGAKFKKAMSASDEREIARSWGVDFND